jgi:hypothetical protein
LLFNNNNNLSFEKIKGAKKKKKMQNKSNLNMSVGSIPAGNGQRSLVMAP